MLNVSWQDSLSWPVSVTPTEHPGHVAAVTGEAVGAVFGGTPVDRRRATSWPMVAPLSAAVATRLPVGPVDGRSSSARAAVVLLGPLGVVISRCSVMVAGGVRLVLPVMPKKATSWALALVVVTGGAVIVKAAALVWPLWP